MSAASSELDALIAEAEVLDAGLAGLEQRCDAMQATLDRLPGTVYLLHFARPYHHARHYAGWTIDTDPARRLAEHLAGQGAPLVRAVVAAGIRVELALHVPGDRGLERRWHHRHGTRMCPTCRSQRPPRPRQLRLPILTGGRRRAASLTPLWRFAHV